MPSQMSEREQAIVLEIVGELRPEERFLAADYFVASNRRWNFRGSPVDFGLESELNVITPWVTMVVIWAYGIIKGEIRAALEERIRNIARKVFKIKDPVLPLESLSRPVPRADMAAEYDLSTLRIELTNYGVTLGLERQRAVILAELAVAKAREAIG